MDSLSITLTNDLSELDSVIETTDEFCKAHGIAQPIINNVNISLDELLSNTIHYGYSDSVIHQIKIRIRYLNPTLTIELIDDGVAFDPTSYPPPDVDTPLLERQKGGLGIFFVHRLMDSVDYIREDDKNIVRITKTCQSD